MVFLLDSKGAKVWFSDWNPKVQKCSFLPKTHKCTSCKCRQELTNAYLFANFDFDKTEKGLSKFAKNQPEVRIKKLEKTQRSTMPFGIIPTPSTKKNCTPSLTTVDGPPNLNGLCWPGRPMRDGDVGGVKSKRTYLVPTFFCQISQF